LKIKKAIIYLVLVLLSVSTFGQIGFNNKCEALNSFINSKNVLNWFGKSTNSPDSTLYFLDPDNKFSNCSINLWQGCHAIVINSGPLIDSLKKYDFNFLIKKRFNYYQLREYNDGKDIMLLFHRGIDNVSSSVKLKIRKGKYYLTKVESGVF